MLTRRKLILFTTIFSVARMEQVHGKDPASIRDGMVDRARYYLKTTDWAPTEAVGEVEKRYYCNVFVADVASDVGGRTWDLISGSFGRLNQHDPLAADWENPRFRISGWEVAFDASKLGHGMSASDVFEFRQPGDVISGGGHMGIMSDDRSSESRLVFSASAETGKVELNDWSFRLPNTDSFRSAAEYSRSAAEKASRFTVRRFVGV